MARVGVRKSLRPRKQHSATEDISKIIAMSWSEDAWNFESEMLCDATIQRN
jgi:hypothetical protein